MEIKRFGKRSGQIRTEWLEKTLKKIPNGSRILDAGAGQLRFKPLCSHLKYVSQDFAQYDGVGDGKGKQKEKWDQGELDIVCDITNIPEPDNSFDAIMCIEVFEHLPDPIAAIREFSRLLKTGGYLVLTAPRSSLTHYSPYHFYSGFNHYFYETHLKKNTLEILEIVPNGSFFEWAAEGMRLIKNRAIEYVNDKPNLIEQGAIHILLKMLQRFEKKDRSSHEIMCLGYNVFAKSIK
ncbi:MAG: hypothetical protein A2Y10_18640 [Planctomycetes bacterium GWF2_41_51]|nr:MAG: hypothetical protein A2Y10_18640 [Planctomycetes bacterium GWF2_41_51]HBG27134.1 hypothetical protein [Phycisphaerales bacterium]